jgi:hypothetical protein
VRLSAGTSVRRSGREDWGPIPRLMGRSGGSAPNRPSAARQGRENRLCKSTLTARGIHAGARHSSQTPRPRVHRSGKELTRFSQPLRNFPSAGRLAARSS